MSEQHILKLLCFVGHESTPEVFSHDPWMWRVVSCLRLRLSPWLLPLILLSARASLMTPYSLPVAQVEEDTLYCTYWPERPVMDGLWTTKNEWVNSTELKMAVTAANRNQTCAFRLKHDGYYLSIIADVAFAGNFSSMFTEVLVGIDVNGQKGVAPQKDDYLFRMLFTQESYGVMDTIFYDQGNGVGWVRPKYFTQILPVAGYGVGNYSSSSSPYNSGNHWACEMEISLKFLGARETYGFYISARNSDLDTVFSFPKNASFERPDTWGRLARFQFPDLQVVNVWAGDASGKWIFPKPGREYYLWTMVRNLGNVSAYGFKLSMKTIFEDDPQKLEAYCGFVESNETLRPNQTRKIGLYVPVALWWLRRLGEHQIKVSVNEDRSTPELNYTNNEFLKDYLVDYGYILTIKLPYENMTARIDGRPFVSDPFGEINEAFLSRKYSLEVPGLAFPKHGTEVKFQKFSDGYNSTRRQFNLTDDIVFEVKYGVRFLLEIDSKYGDPKGAGWHTEGVMANISVSPVVDFGNGTRLAFVRWILPGNRLHPYPAASIMMDEPKKAQVVWKKQFYLRVISEYGVTRGEGWYDAGSVANFWTEQATGTVIVNTFQEWVGDVKTNTPWASVVMDSPKEVRAVWARSYTRLYIVIGYFALMCGIGAFVAWRVRIYSRRRLLARRKAAASS